MKSAADVIESLVRNLDDADFTIPSSYVIQSAGVMSGTRIDLKLRLGAARFRLVYGSITSEFEEPARTDTQCPNSNANGDRNAHPKIFILLDLDFDVSQNNALSRIV